MPIRLNSTSDFYARINGDSATAGDGTTSSAPARYDSWNADIGSSSDSSATSDTGTFSLIALIKRVLVRLTDLLPDPTVDRSIGAAVSKVVKSSSGRLYSLNCTNLNASIRYLQFFDSTSVPAGGATPIASYPVYANSGFLVLDVTQFGLRGTSFATGITWGFSTTALTYTAGTATDAIVVVRYV